MASIAVDLSSKPYITCLYNIHGIEEPRDGRLPKTVPHRYVSFKGRWFYFKQPGVPVYGNAEAIIKQAAVAGYGNAEFI